MTQGIYINGERPRSKKAVKEAVAADASSVHLEATSMYPGEYDGPVSELPVSSSPVNFVGPDPYTKRNFYGTITWKRGKLVVT